VDEAFQLASDALAAGVTYSSERVIERARRFRRDFAGPATARTGEFYNQLRTALRP
jgi:hypothetical protein